MIRIIIADDHALFLAGLKSLLGEVEDLDVVGTAENGKEALALIEDNDCDVILLDIDMPEMNGIEAAEKIIADHPGVKILMLTMHDKLVMIEKMLTIGVQGYVLKNTSRPDLTEAIRNLHAGKSHFSREVTDKLAQQFRRSKDAASGLTKREKEVLVLIGEGLKTSEISEKLFISTNTVDTHRKNLYSKAGVKNIVELLNWAKEREYIL